MSAESESKLPNVLVGRFIPFGIGRCVAVWLVPSSSGSRHTTLDPQDEGTTILPNTAHHSPNSILSHCQCLSVHWTQTQPIYSTAHCILCSQHFVRQSTHKKVFQIKDTDRNNICFLLCTAARWATVQDTTNTSAVKVNVKRDFFLTIPHNQKITLRTPRHTKRQDSEINFTGGGSAYGDSIQHQNCSGPAYEHL